MSIGLFLADLALILMVARIFGTLARRVGQPTVVGEILGGVLLGPTLLGDFTAVLFPADVRPALTALANIGVALFMFGVGLEFDLARLERKRRLVVSVSLGSTAFPFALGVLLALLLGEHAPGHRLGFTLFLGMAMAITAFPVLARILEDHGLSDTTIGRVALASAAVCDVAVWVLLAVLVTVVEGHDQGWLRVLLFVPYLLVMTTAVRVLLGRLIARTGTAAALTVVFTGVLVSGASTEWMGLHFIFGAFLFGVVLRMADDAASWAGTVRNMGQINVSLFLPVFFVVAGLGVDLSWMGWTGLAELGVITLVAVCGKFAGVFTAARLHGFESRQAGVLALLMNTRGLTELVLLVIGLRLGLIDDDLYSLMVVMALVTTAMTGPLVKLVRLETRTTP
jgi:Kef-type K+ transport system membrane component KefB